MTRQMKQKTVIGVFIIVLILSLFTNVAQQAVIIKKERDEIIHNAHFRNQQYIIEAQNYELGLRPSYCPPTRKCSECNKLIKPR